MWGGYEVKDSVGVLDNFETERKNEFEFFEGGGWYKRNEILRRMWSCELNVFGEGGGVRERVMEER